MHKQDLKLSWGKQLGMIPKKMTMTMKVQRRTMKTMIHTKEEKEIGAQAQRTVGKVTISIHWYVTFHVIVKGMYCYGFQMLISVKVTLSLNQNLYRYVTMKEEERRKRRRKTKLERTGMRKTCSKTI